MTKIFTEKDISIAHFVSTAGKESPCRRLHGHTLKIQIEIEGRIQDDGMVVDFRDIKEIINRLDHKTLIPWALVSQDRNMLNYRIDTGYNTMSIPKDDVILLPMQAITAENLSSYLAKVISRRCIFRTNIRVRVYEGPVSWAETVYEGMYHENK